jgi:hypothetical protein
MKSRIILGFLITLAACNNSGVREADEDSTGTNITPIENVNGNLPDSSNSISLGGHPADSTKSLPDSAARNRQ